MGWDEREWDGMGWDVEYGGFVWVAGWRDGWRDEEADMGGKQLDGFVFAFVAASHRIAAQMQMLFLAFLVICVHSSSFIGPIHVSLPTIIHIHIHITRAAPTPTSRSSTRTQTRITSYFLSPLFTIVTLPLPAIRFPPEMTDHPPPDPPVVLRRVRAYDG
ncbi:hypothetical protein M422DRAFT_249670 [Sphaerobolus stellatus SS14]|uniref:Unplaced genomic scaffold SPHSTscaffold_30, whole genome shotgun sequence n=1 Tax=Sphaerobolus stellatus (strain SS14) TaxID=990650 RepID=A0A0C9VI04_SPHS4|nr:hypothetical protein M422DRAFT_249670 [Sphaerobolus stellatus SS14]